MVLYVPYILKKKPICWQNKHSFEIDIKMFVSHCVPMGEVRIIFTDHSNTCFYWSEQWQSFLRAQDVVKFFAWQ